MSTSIHPNIASSNFDMEDAFSSTNIPDCTSASPNYSPASRENTFFDSLKNLTQNLLAALAISPFHDDPYMKVMQAYYATNELPISPPPAPIALPIILPPSPVLSQHFDSRDFFLSKEILPPRKQAHELHLERMEEMENKIRGLGNGRVIIQRDFDRLETKLEEARTQIAGLQKKKIGHDDEVVLARVRISTLEKIIEDIQVCHRSDIRNLLDAIRELKNNKITMDLLSPDFLKPLYTDFMNVVHNQDIEHMIPPTSPRDTKTPIGSPIPLSPSSSVGSSSPVRSTTQSSEYPFDESIFAELDNSLWIIPMCVSLLELVSNKSLSKFPYIVQMTCDIILIWCSLVNIDKMAPKRTSTSLAPTMTQAAIRKLVADSVAAALEAQVATMANTDNTNRNTEQRETPVARKCSYKKFMGCQPFNFKGIEGTVRLIRWFERSESIFSRNNCTEDCKVKFTTGIVTEEAYPGGIHSPNLLE
nr:reverse transcriptase domain-containing protein [Tanacetum cinerariifolium]